MASKEVIILRKKIKTFQLVLQGMAMLEPEKYQEVSELYKSLVVAHANPAPESK